MFLADASVRRPVATAALVLILLVFGANVLRSMGVDAFPRVEFPYITVVTVDPGSTPEEIERSVARELEDALSSVDGLKHMTTVCRDSVVQVLLEFGLDVDVDVAAFDVREKIDAVRADLPPSAEEPKVLKFDINAKAVVTLALAGEAPLDELYDLADRKVRDRLSVLLGVAQVDLLGGSDLEVEVVADPQRLASAGLTSLDLVRALNEGNAKIPAGRFHEGVREISVVVDAEAVALSDLRKIIVADRQGARVRLGDVADVHFGHEERRQLAFLDGRPSIGLRVVKKGEANAVKVVERVRQAVEDVRSELPAGVDLVWVADDGDFIQTSVNDAWWNILVGILLTAGILLVFLHDIRSTIIVSLTMPLSVLITFAVIGSIGYTLNTSTLLGIGISVGILVANSIVVLEAIIKRRQEGEGAPEAARRGTHEVMLAVLASAATNVVVFVPIGLMQSAVGKYFGPFAVTAATATAASLLVSFTVTPMLASVLLRHDRRAGRLARLWDRMYGPLEAGYAASIRWTEKFSVVVIVAAMASLVWAIVAARGLGLDFVPDVDQGRLQVQLEYASSQNLTETARRVRLVEETIGGIEGIERRFTTVGKIEGVLGQVSEGVYLAEISLVFAPKTSRSWSLQEVRDQVREALADIPGCRLAVTLPTLIGGSAKPVELEISGDDLDVVERLTRDAFVAAHQVPGLKDVDTSVRVGKPEVRLVPDRDLLADTGLAPARFGRVVRGNLEGIKAGVFRQGNRSWDIRIQLAEQQGRSQVGAFALPGMAGMPVRLAAFAEQRLHEARVQVLRAEKRRAGKVFANLEAGTALGDATEALIREIERRGGQLPGFRVRFVGMQERLDEAARDFTEAGLLAVVLTYLVLCAILESWLLPLLVLLTVPLAAVGTVAALLLTGWSANIFVMLSGVMLVGLVVNNAILMIDRARQLMEGGESSRAAMARAARDRLRPIVMTSIAAILGMLPLAMGQGLGSELRAGAGIAAVGGLVVSTVLSLYLVPAGWFLTHRKAEG